MTEALPDHQSVGMKNVDRFRLRPIRRSLSLHNSTHYLAIGVQLSPGCHKLLRSRLLRKPSSGTCSESMLGPRHSRFRNSLGLGPMPLKLRQNTTTATELRRGSFPVNRRGGSSSLAWGAKFRLYVNNGLYADNSNRTSHMLAADHDPGNGKLPGATNLALENRPAKRTGAAPWPLPQLERPRSRFQHQWSRIANASARPLHENFLGEKEACHVPQTCRAPTATPSPVP